MLLNEKNQKYYSIVKLLMFVISFITLCFVFYYGDLRSDDSIYVGFRNQSLAQVSDYILYYGNGRLLGNYLGCALSCFLALRVILKSSVIVFIIGFIPYLFNCKRLLYYSISFAVILGCSYNLFETDFIFNSGFANYVPPVLCALICLYIIKLNDEKKLNDILSIVIIFSCSVMGQLFVESSSILNISLPFILFFIFSGLNKNTKPIISWIFGSVIGLWVMFLVPVIFPPRNTLVSEYRGLRINGINEILISIRNSMFEFLGWFDTNYALTSLIFITIVVLIFYCKKLKKREKTFLISINVFSYVYFIVLSIATYNIYSFGIKNYYVATILTSQSLMILISFFISSFTLMIKCEYKKHCLAFIVLFATAFCPLLVVYPLRESVFFHIIVIILAISIKLIDKHLKINSKYSEIIDICSALISFVFSGLCIIRDVTLY